MSFAFPTGPSMKDKKKYKLDVQTRRMNWNQVSIYFYLLYCGAYSLWERYQWPHHCIMCWHVLNTLMVSVMLPWNCFLKLWSYNTVWFYSHKSIAFFGKVALLCLVVSRGSVRCKKPQKHDYLEFNYSGSYFAPKKMQCFLSELYLIFKKFVGNGFIFIC